jgi:hypothetical protein
MTVVVVASIVLSPGTCVRFWFSQGDCGVYTLRDEAIVQYSGPHPRDGIEGSAPEAGEKDERTGEFALAPYTGADASALEDRDDRNPTHVEMDCDDGDPSTNDELDTRTGECLHAPIDHATQVAVQGLTCRGLVEALAIVFLDVPLILLRSIFMTLGAPEDTIRETEEFVGGVQRAACGICNARSPFSPGMMIRLFPILLEVLVVVVLMVIVLCSPARRVPTAVGLVLAQLGPVPPTAPRRDRRATDGAEGREEDAEIAPAAGEQAPGERDEYGGDVGLCVVCMNARVSRLPNGCAHVSMCGQCSERVDPRRCPVCVAPFTSTARVHVP